MRHYRKAYATNPMQFNVWINDITPVLDRLKMYRDNRWSFQRIADKCGISHTILADIHSGRQARCRKKTYDAVLKLPPLEGVAVTPVGWRRRVHALAWMGWGGQEVAVELGITVGGLRDATSNGKFSPELGVKLQNLYRRISHIEGPNKVASSRAKSRRYMPPGAWDDDEIDTAPDLKAGIVRTDRKLRGKYRTHCKRNHEQTEENVIWKPGNVRKCRLCHNLNIREYRKRQRMLKTA